MDKVQKTAFTDEIAFLQFKSPVTISLYAYIGKSHAAFNFAFCDLLLSLQANATDVSSLLSSTFFTIHHL
jgi:hypothetical protein